MMNKSELMTIKNGWFWSINCHFLLCSSHYLDLSPAFQQRLHARHSSATAHRSASCASSMFLWLKITLRMERQSRKSSKSLRTTASMLQKTLDQFATSLSKLASQLSSSILKTRSHRPQSADNSTSARTKFLSKIRVFEIDFHSKVYENLILQLHISITMPQL